MESSIIPVRFYQIISRLNSSIELSVRPLEPSVADSLLTQDVPGTTVAPEFLWGFIEAGPNRYRIFNCYSGYSAVAMQSPPFQQEKVQQAVWQYGIAKQVWEYNGDLFISTVNPDFVWELEQDTAPPHPLILARKTGLPNQQFRLKEMSSQLVAAAQSAGS